MVTEVVVVTELVVTVKLWLVVPAVTVTLDGTWATDELLLESETTAPPEGAAALRVTVPVDQLPPTTLLGLRAREDNAGEAVPMQPGKLKEAIRVLQATPLVGWYSVVYQ